MDTLTFPSLEELAADDRRGSEPKARDLGGKGARLVWLQRNGFHVPPGRIIATTHFDKHCRAVLPVGFDVRSILRLFGSREGLERAGRAHAQLLDSPLPQPLLDTLEEAFRGLTQPLTSQGGESAAQETWGIAVRSSATCEDQRVGSLAGLAVTRLGVRTLGQLADALREVWASLLLPRALGYLADLRISHASMAVVLQRMVVAEQSAVAIVRESDRIVEGKQIIEGKQAGSARGERSLDISINAGFGLGAPLVGGTSAPDVLRVLCAISRDTSHVNSRDTSSASERQNREETPTFQVSEQTLGRTKTAWVIGPDGEQAATVKAEQANTPVLSEPRLLEICRVAAKLSRLGPGPWEVEVAFRHDELWMLQARPVVERGFPEGGEEDTVWSCANLAEALPGVATPLTWSVAESFSELGFRRAFSALGCTVPKGMRLFGNVHGRFYLNLTAFMRVAATVPLLDPATLLELGGGSGSALLREQVRDVSHRSFYLRLPLTAARFLKEQTRLESDLSAYEYDADRVRRAFEARDLGILTDDGVATTLRDLQRFLDRTGALMLTCASGSLGSFVALRTLLAYVFRGSEKSGLEKATSRLAEDVTSGGVTKGFGEIESARPTVALVRIAEIALGDIPAMQRLLREPPPKLLADIPAGPTADAFERWLHAYGDRAVREAELSTPRWREDPSFPLQTLALYVARAVSGQPYGSHAGEVSVRADQTRERIEAKLSLLERTSFRHLVSRCQRFSRLRERMRAWVTWVLGAIRTAALEAERRLRRRDPNMREGDVFFCTVEEILGVLRGEPRVIGRIIELRRAEYARDLARIEPPITFVGRPSPVRLEALGGSILHGHGASPGVVTGPVRFIASPADARLLMPGEILVTRTTDVGWTPLFVAAAGVVTELGGPLSHAAIVARELGVPCVVNAEGATSRLRDGMIVRLDGDRGLVEVTP